MTENTVPTSEFLLSVLWLGHAVSAGVAVPVGSGVAIRHQDQEYLATALHVAEPCGFQPLVRRYSEWASCQWETVGTDREADVAVLKTSTANLSPLTPRYGLGHVILGGVGRAMGFPAITDLREISHVAEIDGLPVPLTTLVSAYVRPETNAAARIHYTGGYVNAGFSGGAMLLPTSTGWTIAGIITHREGVIRNLLRKNTTTGELEEDSEFAYSEPSGLIRFADIGVVTDIIEGAR
ncbi:MAG: trypsin-like peptidase domain-containing protein [Dehalococcoidia bacterium]|nr:trypsin-like peptidase domain-containing protein [Dehalococcoidia bacterium]